MGLGRRNCGAHGTVGANRLAWRFSGSMACLMAIVGDKYPGPSTSPPLWHKAYRTAQSQDVSYPLLVKTYQAE